MAESDSEVNSDTSGESGPYPTPKLVTFPLMREDELRTVLTEVASHNAHLVTLHHADLQFIDQLEEDSELSFTLHAVSGDGDPEYIEETRESGLYSRVLTIQRAFRNRAEFAVEQKYFVSRFWDYYSSVDTATAALKIADQEIDQVLKVLTTWNMKKSMVEIIADLEEAKSIGPGEYEVPPSPEGGASESAAVAPAHAGDRTPTAKKDAKKTTAHVAKKSKLEK